MRAILSFLRAHGNKKREHFLLCSKHHIHMKKALSFLSFSLSLLYRISLLYASDFSITYCRQNVRSLAPSTKIFTSLHHYVSPSLVLYHTIKISAFTGINDPRFTKGLGNGPNLPSK